MNPEHTTAVANRSAAPTSNIAVRDLISICTSLIGLLEQETTLLQEMQAGQINSLQDQKTTLALTYQQQIRELAGDPQCFRAVEPVLRDELRSALEAVNTASVDNERAIRAARTANEKVIQAVVDAVAVNDSESATYGRDGSLNLTDGAAGRPPAAVSINQQL